MKCKCPKCSFNIDIELSQIPERGQRIKCPGCKKSWRVDRESFAGRALRKSGYISCSECGEPLDQRIACPRCLALYPEYFVVQDKIPVRKQPREFSLSLPSFRRSSSATRRVPTAARPRGKTSRKVTPLVYVAVLVIAVGGILGYFYRQHKAEEEYSRNFVRVLYTIKTGRDTTHEKIVATISKLTQSGETYISPQEFQDETALTKIKSSADKLMQRIGKPPGRYARTNEKLVKLYGTYSRMDSFMSSHPTSLDRFKTSSEQLEKEFAECVQDIKADLPEPLMQRVKQAQVRYKNLQNI